MQVEKEKRLYFQIEKQKKFNTNVVNYIKAGLVNKQYDLSHSPYTQSDLTEIFQKMDDCATVLEVREYKDRKAIHNANYCSHPHVCAICAARVSNRRRKMYSYVPDKKPEMSYRLSIQEASQKFNYAYFLTASIENGPNLKERLEHLQESLRKFVKMGQKRKSSHSRGEWSKVKAALANVENKRGKLGGDWHPHIHFIAFTNEQLDFKVYDQTIKQRLIADAANEGRILSKEELLVAANRFVDYKGLDKPVSKFTYEWFKASGSINFDVSLIERIPTINKYMSTTEKKRLLKIRKKVIDQNLDYSESVMMQASEIFKYNTKIDGNDFRSHASDFAEILTATKNKRLFRNYGDFRKAGDNEGTEYEESENESPLAIYSVRYNYKNRCYQDEKNESDRPVFTTSNSPDRFRRYLLGETAKLQGAYRKARTAYYDENKGRSRDDIEEHLDTMKDDFRERCKTLWEQYARYFKKNEQALPDFIQV